MRLRPLAILIAALFVFVLSAPGCGSDDEADPFPVSGKKGGEDGEEICLLNNCETDAECADCSKDRTVCSKAEKRCVACGPNANNKKCKPGQLCTKYGDCVPNGVTCEEDEAGVPTANVVCNNNADCAACGPKFKVCDTSTSKCVGCIPSDTTNCQSTDTCRDNTCVPKCPAECGNDGACSECGIEGKENHACNRHKCGQCSPGVPCKNGQLCDYDHGTCYSPCGLGKVGATNNCKEQGNCAGCTGTTTCKLPVNGGDGVCAVPANGCSDLGGTLSKFTVLPDPFSRYTQTCSEDVDCANVSADINVGKVLRDLTGLNLIKDANVSYAMHACAAIEVMDKACGICVPCKQDTDCMDIDVKKLAGDMFGKIGSVGASLLMDKVFGPNDKKIHMYCQNIAGDYGACLPCGNPLARCAVGGEVPAGGSCSHGVCEEGGPLGVNCGDACIATVCAKDSYCCTKEWDFQCKQDVDIYCTGKTCEPDSCSFRGPGWYCRNDTSEGGYRCEGGQNNSQISEGSQCPGGKYCHRTGSNPKDPAVLCQTENEQGCGAGMVGKPKCFDSAQ